VAEVGEAAEAEEEVVGVSARQLNTSAPAAPMSGGHHRRRPGPAFARTQQELLSSFSLPPLILFLTPTHPFPDIALSLSLPSRKKNQDFPN
jgi:hypothetical protein